MSSNSNPITNEPENSIEWKVVGNIKREKEKSKLKEDYENPRKKFQTKKIVADTQRLLPSKPNQKALNAKKENPQFPLDYLPQHSMYSKIFKKTDAEPFAVDQTNSNLPTVSLETKPKSQTKSKPEKKIALFDVLMASQQQKPSETHLNETPKLHPNVARVLETKFEPRNFVFQDGKKKKRKKQLSVLKKKVLKVSFSFDDLAFYLYF
jgi:hypothetical protein